jgi:solute carrier family 39 (zinc transporter), member 1/2/3
LPRAEDSSHYSSQSCFIVTTLVPPPLPSRVLFDFFFGMRADSETFEGMGLGARIATLSFPRNSIRPYLMGLLFALVTPLGMALGLAIRTLYSPTSPTALITTGIFDAISAGLLIYASLVELLAHEFLMGEMRFEGIGRIVLAGGCIIMGAAVMTLLGLWA